VKEEILLGKLTEVKITDWQLTNDITALVRKSRYQSRILAEFWKMLHQVN
jgi:hypothetical protein